MQPENWSGTREKKPFWGAGKLLRIGLRLTMIWPAANIERLDNGECLDLRCLIGLSSSFSMKIGGAKGNNVALSHERKSPRDRAAS